jgi:hypothetical protein
LLLLITQIKHFMGQAQAQIQFLNDAYEGVSDEEEPERRRLMAAFAHEVAARMHSIAHPHPSTNLRQQEGEEEEELQQAPPAGQEEDAKSGMPNEQLECVDI